MLHDDFRDARVAAGLSQSELARRAGVPRRQIQQLENGSNVTIDTLRRIIPALPNLTRVTLGGMEIVTANADLERARRAAFALFDVVKELMAALGAGLPPPASAAASEAPPTPGVIRGGTGSEDERRTAERLQRMIKQGKHKRRSDA